MKILYVCQYFPPEMGAPAARASELGVCWTKQGHDVTVLTGFPNHPTGKVPPDYRGKLRRLWLSENWKGVRVERTWLVPLPNRKSWERMVNYASFCISAAIRGTFLSKPDRVIATSPQLLVGLAGLWIAKVKRVPFLFEVRDLWPESLIAVGASSENSLLERVLGFLAGMLYRLSDHIVVVTPAFADHLVRFWSVPSSKISVAQNGVDTDVFRPEGDRSAMAANWKGKFVVSFIGTIGNAHGVDTIVETAKRMRTIAPDVLFVIVGEGAEKESIRALVAASGLENVEIHDQQPRSEIPALIRSSDVCLVLLRQSDVFKTVIPTKMLEFMACGRPVILGVEGQALELMQQAEAGIAIPPENAPALEKAILTIYADSKLRQKLGENGSRYIAGHLSRHRTAEQYAQVIGEISSSDEVTAAVSVLD